jgi:hypothetical protein
LGRKFLVAQAALLLEFAKATSDPELSAKLIAKAADINARAELLPELNDASAAAPDVIEDAGERPSS